jgi:hypothetical protein
MLLDENLLRYVVETMPVKATASVPTLIKLSNADVKSSYY